jgi:hypothetical protein
MDKLKVIQGIIIIVFIIVFKYLISKETGCDINKENKSIMIQGVVIKRYNDKNDHNIYKLLLSNKQVVHGGTVFKSLCFSSNVGDSLYKPIGSLVVTVFPKMFEDTIYYNIALDCDTLTK